MAVSQARLRYLALSGQGLAGKRKIGSGIGGVQKALKQLGFVQIDTISVVARAHHHTLFTRVAKYAEGILNTLVRQHRAFEYWGHAASYLPMRDFRFSLPMKRAVARDEVRRSRSRDEKVRAWVRDRIRAEGPLFARDFEDPRKQHKGWWDWKPAKLALEQLFMEGELMSVERQGFQKRYELTQRFLPSSVDTREPGLDEHADHVIDRVLAAHGFSSEKTCCHFRWDARVRSHIRKRLKVRANEGDLTQERTKAGEIIYLRPEALTQPVRKMPDMVRILSPFDNTMIERRRAKAVFDFDYTIECYVPEKKRVYGYFALPIVFRNAFVGRMDCKAHRAEDRFEIKALFLEAPERDMADDAFLAAFGDAVRDYAAFVGCQQVSVGSVSPRALAQPVKRLFR